MGEEKAVTYFGGMTTDPEVKRLREAFPPSALTVETVVTYEAISAVIGIDHAETRWRTIVTRWRRLIEKEDNVRLVAQTGRQSLVVHSPSDRLRDAVGQWGRAKRVLSRSATRVSRVDFEPGPEHDKQQHILRYTAMAVNQLGAGQKALPSPPKRPAVTQREAPATATKQAAGSAK